MDTDFLRPSCCQFESFPSVTVQLKEEVQSICEKLASFGEESVFISINKYENTSNFRGSKFGQDFILNRLHIIDQFYHCCMGYASNDGTVGNGEVNQKSNYINKDTANNSAENSVKYEIPSSLISAGLPNTKDKLDVVEKTSPLNTTKDVSVRTDSEQKESLDGSAEQRDDVSDLDIFMSHQNIDASEENLEQEEEKFEESNDVTDKFETNSDRQTQLTHINETKLVDQDIQHEISTKIPNDSESVETQSFDYSEEDNDNLTDLDMYMSGDEDTEILKEETKQECVDNSKDDISDLDMYISHDNDNYRSEEDTLESKKEKCEEVNSLSDRFETECYEHPQHTRPLKIKLVKSMKEEKSGKVSKNALGVEMYKCSFENQSNEMDKSKKSVSITTQTTEQLDFAEKKETDCSNLELEHNKCDIQEGIKGVTSKNVILTKLNDSLTRGFENKKSTKMYFISNVDTGLKNKLALKQENKNINSEIQTTEDSDVQSAGQSSTNMSSKIKKTKAAKVVQIIRVSGDKAKIWNKKDKSITLPFGYNRKKRDKIKTSNKVTVPGCKSWNLKKRSVSEAKGDDSQQEENIPESASIVYPDGRVEQVPVKAVKENELDENESTTEGKILTKGNKKSYYMYLRKKKKDTVKDSNKEKVHICNVCGKVYKYKKNLKDHMFKHSGDYPFSCPLCDRKFPKKGPMQTHLNNHLEYKMFMCEFCGKCFASTGLLTEHRKVHREGKPYACNFCDKRFPRKTYLTKHLKFHKENKEYMCEECGKTFYTSTHLKRHCLIHTGIKQYRCDLCPYECNQSGNLKIHMKVHRRDME